VKKRIALSIIYLAALCSLPFFVTEAQIKISALPAASSATGSDVTIIVQSGVTKKISIANLLTGQALGGTTTLNGPLSRAYGGADPTTIDDQVGPFSLQGIRVAGNYALDSPAIGNIFPVFSSARNSGSAPVTGIAGFGFSSGATSNSFGGNFVAYNEISGGHANAVELDGGNLVTNSGGEAHLLVAVFYGGHGGSNYIQMSSGSTSSEPDDGISFEGTTRTPVKSTGKAIKTVGSWTVADFIDASSITCTDAAFKSVGAIIDGSGNFNGQAYGGVYFDASSGFRVGGAAASGKVLRGNGSYFLSATLAFSDLSGSLTSGQDYTSGISAGTYRSVTVNTTGRATGGTNPTTFAGYGLSDTSANLAASLTDETGSGPAVFATGPAISGGSHVALTSFGIRSTGAAFDLTIASTEVFTAGRTLTIKVNDAARTIDIAGNLTLAAAFSTSGANALTLTTTGSTNVTLPTSGTLVNSSVATLSSLASIGTITTGTWNATVIGSQYGGTGQNWSASSGLPSVNSGAWSLNTVTQNGVAFGGASSAVSFTSAAANSILQTNGSNVPSLSQTLPAAVQGNITALGTIASGTVPQANVSNLGYVIVSTQAASSSATIDFTSLDNTYDSYILEVSGAHPATNDVAAWIRIQTGGSTWQTSGYRYGISETGSSGATSLDQSTSDAKLQMSKGVGALVAVGNTSGYNWSGEIKFQLPASSNFLEARIDGQYSIAAGTDSVRIVGGGRYDTVGAITGIRFLFSSGNVSSGQFTLYGRRKS
jgi:hypothetical protein